MTDNTEYFSIFQNRVLQSGIELRDAAMAILRKRSLNMEVRDFANQVLDIAKKLRIDGLEKEVKIPYSFLIQLCFSTIRQKLTL